MTFSLMTGLKKILDCSDGRRHQQSLKCLLRLSMSLKIKSSSGIRKKKNQKKALKKSWPRAKYIHQH